MIRQSPPAPNLALIRQYNMPLLLLNIAVIVFFVWTLRIEHGYFVDERGFIFGRDFVNFWHYGQGAWTGAGASYYDPLVYNARLDALIPGHNYPDQLFSYPPHYMLVAAPFGLLGYHMALAVFTFLGLTLYWFTIVRPFPDAPLRIALFVVPTIAVLVICGQVSAFLAVLLVWIYRTLDTRPVLAGLLIALLTVKPQIGVLLPVFLLATGRWRVCVYAGLFSAGFLAVSVAVHGWQAWQDYLTVGISNQSATLFQSSPLVLGLMPTVLVDMAVLGASRSGALMVHALAMATALFFMILVIRRTQDAFLRYAAFLVATFLATPYLMAYDTLVLGWVMLTLCTRFETDRLDRITYRLAMSLCPVGVVLTMFGLPGTPLILALLAVWILKAVPQADTVSALDEAAARAVA